MYQQLAYKIGIRYRGNIFIFGRVLGERQGKADDVTLLKRNFWYLYLVYVKIIYLQNSELRLNKKGTFFTLLKDDFKFQNSTLFDVTLAFSWVRTQKECHH